MAVHHTRLTVYHRWNISVIRPTFRIVDYIYDDWASCISSLIARFMGPTWGPSGTDRTQVGPMLAPWILLSGIFTFAIMDNLRRRAPGFATALRWRHNDHAGVSNHQPHGCLLNRLFRRKSKKTSKLRVTGLCAGNSPGTGEFPAQMASYAENVSIWWRHHG